MSPLTHAVPNEAEDRRPLHVRRVHATPVDGCYGCKVAGVTLQVPIAFRGIR